ncbi:MAG: hypothetical protein Q7T50_02450, partial [Candidatus Magasanikbacteria bacterium]|nr:hypothetical protein [Candidatus Magasanikbacteria bacterium]
MRQKNRNIAAITNDDLFKGDYFQGFSPIGKIDFWKRICEEYTLVNRRKADKDITLKQPVIVFIIYSPKQKKLFFFR